MISPAHCHYSELIFDYLDATIDDHQAIAFEAHLSDCPDCLAMLKENMTEPQPEGWLHLLQNPFPAGELQNTAPVLRDTAGTEHASEHASSVLLEKATHADTPAGSSQSPPASEIRYTRTRQLGSGGSGDVWEAWDQLLCRPVALKFLRNATAPLDETHRFLQEATALARLSHPHIVSIHELQNVRGLPVLVMELVPGPSLAQYLRGRPCPPTAAAALLEQLCQAVEHAHSLGVIHRDLKPSNVLLKPAPGLSPPTTDSRPELSHWLPKVADFGLARISDQPTLTLPGQHIGTPSYMAPEQVSATPQNTGPATDIYGLGALLYELLTGRPPFACSDPTLTMAMILDSDPVPPRALVQGIPQDLETICMKCLRKEPQSRYLDVATLRQDCIAFLQNRPIAARPISRPRRMLAWARRHPTESTALFACLCLLVAVTAGSLRNAGLSNELASEALEKVTLLEQTHALQRQQQDSVRSRFDQLLQAHYRFLQMLGDPARPQPLNPEAIRAEILRSASEIAVPYIELLDQKIAAGHHPTPPEVRLAVDYLDLAFKAGAAIDFATRLPALDRLIQNLAPHSAPQRELLEVKIRLESLNARFAAHQKQHASAGQFNQNMAELIDLQLLTFKPDDPARVERLYMKTAMLMNATFEYSLGNRRELALSAAIRAEDTTETLIKADPGNQNWLALLLEVRLRKSEFLPVVEAAELATSTLRQFQNTHWDSPHNAEKARQIQTRLQACVQIAAP